MKLIILLVILIVVQDLVLAKNLKVYWNIPSFMCHQYQINFTELARKFNIIQNRHDQFRGDQFNILYEPGLFPALLKLSNGSVAFRNGGVPQEGSLYEHIQAFRQDVDRLVPDVNNSGIAVIDFEMWRPILRQNFGSLVPCKTISYSIERSLNPFSNRSQYELEASKRFEKAGREFMAKTLNLAKQMRPYAQWGYYAFPYCFNGADHENCSEATQAENDRLHWLFADSDVILPSVYISEKNIKVQNRAKMVRGRVREAVRVANQQQHKPPVLTYTRYVYTDTRKFLTKEDWITVLENSKLSGASGIILWGSSSDLNTRLKCKDFYSYVESTMGPLISEHTNIEEVDVDVPCSSAQSNKPINVIFFVWMSMGVLLLSLLSWTLCNQFKSGSELLPQEEK